ncbi:hypothetical protein B0H11DRAFT_2058388 [Mycena galericulata]|nr:hypothetical protein B0H11DRAFT_2058388 [Mycena galericulata]
MNITPSTPRSRLAQIEQAIARLEAQLAALRAERDQIRGSLCYPILTLPTEITIEIFMRYAAFHGIGASLLLASVCRLWRAIAFSTGELWATILFRTGDFWRMRDVQKLIQFHLAHAGMVPLDLLISFPHAPDVRNQVLSALVQHALQWRSLDLLLHTPSFIDSLKRPLPSLTKLEIQVDRRTEGGPPITAFARTPLLREASIRQLSLSEIILPWMQLTKLELRKQTFDECLQILAETPRLQWLYLIPTLPDEAMHGRLGCTLPHLHTLVIVDPHCWLIECLTLPRLESVSSCGALPVTECLSWSGWSAAGDAQCVPCGSNSPKTRNFAATPLHSRASTTSLYASRYSLQTSWGGFSLISPTTRPHFACFPHSHSKIAGCSSTFTPSRRYLVVDAMGATA